MAYMLGYKMFGIKNFCFSARGFLVFSIWEVRKPLTGDFRLPALISNPTAPMKYRHPILNRSFLETETR